ncbi:hypothetical protein BFC20_07465 [Brochothrix thermosphacta]|uniref:Stp1/IreP family PP2C-type Ser/Thr phosphatase n=1 Tax=Brochothrix thermosphacta TaxID=2756 RepID=UPI000E7473DC|nr:Stp1/IreP family PP2C-type Ser/Thr phosphatase [Brochothrix thermosphacta]ANZ97539.1 hypothetical protein BFC20_07465 [Brochothrix thermosphacta]
MRAVGQTDKGKVRTNNEDRVAIITNQTGQQLFVVADGMGGHRAGQIASELTVSYLTTYFEKLMIRMDDDQAQRWLGQTLQLINEKLFQEGELNPDLKGMGTTIVCAIDIDEDTLAIAHVGDSRAYIVNEKEFKQITEDHSLVQELVKKGEISNEEAKIHPRRNIVLRSLGVSGFVKVECQIIEKESKDILLLCSDGLNDALTEQEMITLLTSKLTIEDKVKKLIDAANTHGGQDNISVIIAVSEKGGDEL